MQSDQTVKKQSRLALLTQQKLEALRRAAAQAEEAEIARAVEKSSDRAEGVGMGHDNNDLFVPQDDVNAARESSTTGKPKHRKNTSFSAITSLSNPDHTRSDVSSYLGRRPSNDSGEKVSGLQSVESSKTPGMRLRVGLMDTIRHGNENVGLTSSGGGTYSERTASASRTTKPMPISGPGYTYYGLDPENSLLPWNDGGSKLTAATEFGDRPGDQTDNVNRGLAQVAATEKANDMENTQVSEPECVCSISTNCPRAAQKGIKDCRTSLAPVYARNKVKVQKNAP